jgi:beta-galactosidase
MIFFSCHSKDSGIPTTILVPYADALVKFDIEGEGTIVGVDNGNPVSIESFKGPQRKAYNGMCLIIVKSTKNKGQIKLSAIGERLQSDSIVMESN